MADLKLIYGADAPLDALKGKTVAMLGFGSQGHAHSLNLRDSGIKVIVANSTDTANDRLAVEHGFEPMTVDRCGAKAADLIIMTLPDEVQPDVYNKSIAPHLKRRARRWAPRTASISISRRSSRPRMWT